jgi:hypothetical protein
MQRPPESQKNQGKSNLFIFGVIAPILSKKDGNKQIIK